MSLYQKGKIMLAIEIVGLPHNFEGRITAIGNEFIIGRAVIDRFRLILDHGKRVEIRI